MTLIKAAGGVVVDMSHGKPRYLLVHRPRFDDWSLPKGKLLGGEKFRKAALREVKEETGLNCEPIAKLSTIKYRTRNGNPKKVKFWLMLAMSGEFAINEEVDAVVWLKRAEAMTLLSYVHDQAVLVEAHMTATRLRREQRALAPSSRAA